MALKRSEQESFRKRRNNYFRRGDEISQRYKVEICVSIRKENGQYYIYNSNERRDPPTAAQLVSDLKLFS